MGRTVGRRGGAAGPAASRCGQRPPIPRPVRSKLRPCQHGEDGWDERHTIRARSGGGNTPVALYSCSGHDRRQPAPVETSTATGGGGDPRYREDQMSEATVTTTDLSALTGTWAVDA